VRSLRVLITNWSLASYAGTETYVRDLALGLLRRGHTPILYSPSLGEIAQELRRATVPVVDDLNALSVTPDIIHGNQSPELMVALLHFPTVPAVCFCHSWVDLLNGALLHPRVLKYVAVDDTCKDRLLYGHAIPEDRLCVLLNSVDLERFKPRAPLPPLPRRALVFSNYVDDNAHLGAVREACTRFGIQLDVIGSGMNASTAHPELLLGQYDLVFAKARCALESLAVGAAVILCDMRGSGPLVTTGELAHLRRLNFGIRTLTEKVTPDLLAQEIARYDPQDAADVSRRIRATAGLDPFMEEILALYREVIEEHDRAPAHDPLAEGRAAAAYVRWLALNVKWNPAPVQADFLILRLRNRIARVPLLEKPVRLIGRIARAVGL
jgi:hypothetical protein